MAKKGSNQPDKSESSNNHNNHSNVKRSSNHTFKSDKRSIYSLSKGNNSNSSDHCVHCGDIHRLRNCLNFLEKDCFERKSIAEKDKLCSNCSGKSYTLSSCPSSVNCRMYGQRHQTLFHFQTNSSTSQTTSNRSFIIR